MGGDGHTACLSKRERPDAIMEESGVPCVFHGEEAAPPTRRRARRRHASWASRRARPVYPQGERACRRRQARPMGDMDPQACTHPSRWALPVVFWQPSSPPTRHGGLRVLPPPVTVGLVLQWAGGRPGAAARSSLARWPVRAAPYTLHPALSLAGPSSYSSEPAHGPRREARERIGHSGEVPGQVCVVVSGPVSVRDDRSMHDSGGRDDRSMHDST